MRQFTKHSLCLRLYMSVLAFIYVATLRVAVFIYLSKGNYNHSEATHKNTNNLDHSEPFKNIFTDAEIRNLHFEAAARTSHNPYLCTLIPIQRENGANQPRQISTDTGHKPSMWNHGGQTDVNSWNSLYVIRRHSPHQ